jgi:tetratricopeptide (TPR) repeat protein
LDLKLYVVSTQEKPLQGIVVTIKGFGGPSAPTTLDGKTRLPLHPHTEIGASVFLGIVPGEVDHVFIDPWDSRVIVPSPELAPDDFVQAVLAERGKKEELQNPAVIRAIVEKVTGDLPIRPQIEAPELPIDLRLEQVADIFQLSSSDIRMAIEEWQTKVDNPYDKGLSELYDHKYAEAERQFELSLKQREQTLRSANNDAANAALFLGMARLHAGKYGDARLAFQKAATYRPWDPMLLAAQAVVLALMGKSAEAAMLCKQAVEFGDALFGSDADLHAALGGCIATVALLQGNQEGAKQLLSGAVDILVKEYGYASPKVATYITTLARFYASGDQNKELQDLHEHFSAINWEGTEGDDANYITGLLVFAPILAKNGNYQLAESYSKEALETIQDKYGAESQDYAEALSCLGKVYELQGLNEMALTQYLCALEISDRAREPGFPGRSNILRDIANINATLGQSDDAESSLRRAMHIDKETLGEFSPLYTLDLFLLADFCVDQERLDEAEELLLESIPIVASVTGGSGETYSMHLSALAEVYIHQERYADAERTYKDVLGVARELSTGNPGADIKEVSNIASQFESAGRFQDAEIYYRAALRLYEKASDTDEASLIEALGDLARVHQMQGHKRKAATLWRRSAETARNAFGERSREYVDSLRDLAYLYFLEEEYRKVEALLEEIVGIDREVFENTSRNGGSVDYATDLLMLGLTSGSLEQDEEALMAFLEFVLVYEAGIESDAESFSELTGIYEDLRSLFERSNGFAALLEEFRQLGIAAVASKSK